MTAILVWGAGAVGGTIGAHLARAGYDVHLVDRDPAHVAAINEGGLHIEGPLASFGVGVPAMLPEQVDRAYDSILLCTKAQHTAEAADALAPWLSPDGYVASLQNGLNEHVLAERLGAARVIGAFVNFGADYQAPGRILYGGRGAVVVGELDGRSSPRLDRLHQALRSFEPEAITTDDIWAYLWGKLGYGALLFATALTDASIADVLASGRYRPMLTALAREMMELAALEGVAPRGFNGYAPEAFLGGGDEAASFEAMVAHNRLSAKTHSGIWRDLAVRRRPTEVDAQLGMAVEIARRHGHPMPRTERLIALIHDLEAGRRPLDWSTLDALETSDAA